MSVTQTQAARSEDLRAHEHALHTNLAAAQRHGLTAEAHERAAEVHEHAAELGIGDVDTHMKAVAVLRTARDSEYRSAEADLRRAEHE